VKPWRVRVADEPARGCVCLGNPELVDPDGVCGPQSCLQIAMLRALQSFCEKDGPDFVHHRLLVGRAARREMYPDQRGADSAGSRRSDGGSEAGEGVLTKLVTKLMSLPPDSAYRYWITSCVQKWTQASSWQEQQHISGIPGFFSFVVQEVLHCHEKCDNTHKVFCDLLAELIKFNPPQCVRLHHVRSIHCPAYRRKRIDLTVLSMSLLFSVRGLF
jgi:hypothetical protein